MKALLLAAGYATRLRPLTDEIAKPLLPVGGRPMIDWILDSVRASGAVEEVHVVTNSAYATGFARWGAEHGVQVHDDGTSTNDDRLGALGDIRFAMREGGLGDDGLLVIAADNLFEFSLADYIAFWRAKGGSAIAVHKLADPSLASLYGVVELDADDRIAGMEEKPDASAQRPRLDGYLPLLGRAPGPVRPLFRRGQPARPARSVRDVARRTQSCLRLSLQRGLARHRRPGPAARGGQSLPRSSRAACPHGVLARLIRLRLWKNRHKAGTDT